MSSYGHAKTAEHKRLEDKAAGWKQWGPYQ